MYSDILVGLGRPPSRRLFSLPVWSRYDRITRAAGVSRTRTSPSASGVPGHRTFRVPGTLEGLPSAARACGDSGIQNGRPGGAIHSGDGVFETRTMGGRLQGSGERCIRTNGPSEKEGTVSRAETLEVSAAVGPQHRATAPTAAQTRRRHGALVARIGGRRLQTRHVSLRRSRRTSIGLCQGRRTGRAGSRPSVMGSGTCAPCARL